MALRRWLQKAKSAETLSSITETTKQDVPELPVIKSEVTNAPCRRHLGQPKPLQQTEQKPAENSSKTPSNTSVTTSSTIHNDQTNAERLDYEAQRLANIAANQQLMMQLGLLGAAIEPKTKHGHADKPRKKRAKPAAEIAADNPHLFGLRRSKRNRGASTASEANSMLHGDDETIVHDDAHHIGCTASFEQELEIGKPCPVVQAIVSESDAFATGHR